MVVIKYGLGTLLLYLFNSYYWWYIRPGVSHPSGPRRRRMDRQPQWSDHFFPPPPSVAKLGWRYICGKESHHATEISANNNNTNINRHLSKVHLTGEATGRDIWIHDTDKSQQLEGNGTVIVDNDDELVQQLANGGRPLGFQPSANPNRYVNKQCSLRLHEPVTGANNTGNFGHAIDPAWLHL
jgi:hypothetical protein